MEAFSGVFGHQVYSLYISRTGVFPLVKIKIALFSLFVRGVIQLVGDEKNKFSSEL